MGSHIISRRDIYDYNRQILPESESIEYNKQILYLQNRKQKPLIICKIMKQKVQIGFRDYICYADENGKYLIGKFFRCSYILFEKRISEDDTKVFRKL